MPNCKSDVVGEVPMSSLDATPDAEIIRVSPERLTRFRDKVVDLLDGPFHRAEAEDRADEIIAALRMA